VLVWLPSPLGDAVMCTPALKALRENMPSSEIYLLGSGGVRETLSPGDFADGWIEPSGGMLKNVSMLRGYNFDIAILFKNSFSSAFTVFLAGIKTRAGYYRDKRSLFLTHGKNPPRERGRYKPAPMMQYYLGLLECLGIASNESKLSLEVSGESLRQLRDKLPILFCDDRPLVVLVPGGAFGPSKCWPPAHYACLADRLIDNYNARVVVSVAPNEKNISAEICSLTVNELIDLAAHPLTLGQLKALISLAKLVVANDTGPRHIAIALDRAVVTMFGPNDPRWTDSGHPMEEQIVTDEDCAPCQKPYCPHGDARCMENISVESVYAAAEKLLDRQDI
jgi:heptosyltransferase II